MIVVPDIHDSLGFRHVVMVNLKYMSLEKGHKYT